MKAKIYGVSFLCPHCDFCMKEVDGIHYCPNKQCPSFDLGYKVDWPSVYMWPTPKPKKSKWHRVEDELPEPGKLVLVTQARTMIEAWRDENGWHDVFLGIPLSGVTHWREKPKPPERSVK